MKSIAPTQFSRQEWNGLFPGVPYGTKLPRAQVSQALAVAEANESLPPERVRELRHELLSDTTHRLKGLNEPTRVFREPIRGEPNPPSPLLEHLSQTRAGTLELTSSPAKMGPAGERLRLATSLIDLHGPTTDEDRQVVAIELAKLPIKILRELKSDGARVVVTRGSVTTFKPSLKGVRPRGWPPGKTWDNVPGMKSGNNVVIATRLDKDGHSYVPPTGEGHGVPNLVLHEALHRYDDIGNYSNDPKFLSCRELDKTNLKPYWLQAGKAGRQETFAGLGDHVFGGFPGTERTWPNLYRHFWSNHC